MAKRSNSIILGKARELQLLSGLHRPHSARETLLRAEPGPAESLNHVGITPHWRKFQFPTAALGCKESVCAAATSAAGFNKHRHPSPLYAARSTHQFHVARFKSFSGGCSERQNKRIDAMEVPIGRHDGQAAKKITGQQLPPRHLQHRIRSTGSCRHWRCDAPSRALAYGRSLYRST